MKAAVYYSSQDIRIEEMPTPEIGDGEILVNMKACGVCGSDLMDWYLKPRTPLVLGHEPAGIIEKKGKKVDKFNVGDRVFVHHHVACLVCHYCLHGDYTLCKQFHETNIKPGGFAEHFKVPEPNVRTDTLKLPESMSYETATLIEPVACCIRAMRKCNLQTGDTVTIIGAGATGLIHAALSKIYGASRTIVSDFIDDRLRLAIKFGADVTVNPDNADLAKAVMSETEGRGADVAIVTAPSLEAYDEAIGILRKGETRRLRPHRPTTVFENKPKTTVLQRTAHYSLLLHLTPRNPSSPPDACPAQDRCGTPHHPSFHTSPDSSGVQNGTRNQRKPESHRHELGTVETFKKHSERARRERVCQKAF